MENLQNSYISESDYNRIYNYFGSMTDNLIAKIKKDPSFVEVIKACNGNKVIIEAELNNPGLVAKIRSAANPTNKQLSEILSVCTDNSSTNVMLAALEACSVNQAIKAIAIARGFVAPSGDDLVVVPSFNDIVINGENKTAMKLLVTNK